MSMHLEGPWLSATSTKKRAEKLTKAKQEEFERGWRERNVRLKEMGLPKETFEQYLDFVHGHVKDKKTEKNNRKSRTVPVTRLSSRPQTESVGQKEDKGYHSTDKSENTEAKLHVDSAADSTPVPKSLGLWITGPISSKPTPTYTGTKILGIGTMHKSNAVPIFSDDEAKDISRMRR